MTFPTSPRVGFIGFGNMGAHMASNLATHLAASSLPPLLVWNRTPSKLPHASSAIEHAVSLPGLAERCDVVFTSLLNDEAAKGVYSALFKGIKNEEDGRGRETVFVDVSTLYPTTSAELEAQARSVGASYLVAPVFGPPPAAAAAKLVFLLAGTFPSPAAREWVISLMVPTMGRKIMELGDDVKRASSFKLTGNAMVIGAMELTAEALTLAEKTGVGAKDFFEWIKEFFPAAPFTFYGNKMITHSFAGEGGFTVEGGLKDAAHIARLARESGCSMPALGRDLAASVANGGKHLDWSSLVAGPRLAARLNPFTEGGERV
ncbi:hypothetical protein JCM6882_006015 [Rhodosporidiobolus microsporus]